jgi:hypothetical protein
VLVLDEATSNTYAEMYATWTSHSGYGHQANGHQANYQQ